jgi:CRISPR/Cas system-associated exonuclease Cas4 (RecB family)
VRPEVQSRETEHAKKYGLSKSRLTDFEQCPKKLWLNIHKRGVRETDAQSELRFATGHQVGAIACDLSPGGVMIEAQPNLAAALEQTEKLIASGHRGPIYEATFSHDGVLIQADILEPIESDGWRIAEVKSSTSVKDYHIADLATQIWVLENCQINIQGASVRHIDNSFVFQRPDDYAGLLRDVPVEQDVLPIAAARRDVVAEARAVLEGPEPLQEMGGQCSKPFRCQYQNYCRQQQPAPVEWPVSILPRTGRRIANEMGAIGIYDLRDVPGGTLKNPQHEIIRQVTISGAVHHDRDGVRTATKDWAYPRHYLDFETIALAVPIWIGTRPYQQVPFQFSCHTEQHDGQMSHHSFLSVDGSDPRRACAEALIECVGLEGAIIAYNASFERTCVKGLAAALPDLAPALYAIAERFVDLLPVAEDYYYHRDQRGSWSIKKVLPTVAPELAYTDLEVGDGEAAQLAWLEAASPDCPPDRRDQIRTALEKYCERDTWAMFVLLRRLTSAPRG